jgi:heme-degrading monooxygenase HmoA
MALSALRGAGVQSQEEVNRVIVQIVRFKSGLSDEQVLEMYQARAPQYRALKGLIQKYYLRFRTTGEHGAVYLWESEEALKEFRESELARTIPNAYQIQGASDVATAEVVMALRPNVRPATGP